ncbi:DUF6476 family protein [Paracoccus cavernae]|uniref:DUF6476 family protein n=1 Tax=Paracoccus cavernae TaxID=1571207 RepID=A0ABT8D3H9_9RHOB|nr:DUF6476 family protein [Paracoccus cavernae]
MSGKFANENGAEGDVPMVRYLRALVTGLAVVMGLGILAIVAILWLRLGAAPLPTLPDTITLPQGATAEAVTFARNWIVVVTQNGEILLYDQAGTLRDQLSP